MLMDAEIESQVEAAKIRQESEDKIRFITEEVLFPLRQRVMDLQQMLVVNQQGIMAIEVVIRNNKELIRGVDRARNVTVTALKISVTVASALYNQKIVLKNRAAKRNHQQPDQRHLQNAEGSRCCDSQAIAGNEHFRRYLEASVHGCAVSA